MKYLILICFVLELSVANSQDASLTKSLLLKQLKTTHNEKDWFVPVNIALEGLTPEQVALRWTIGLPPPVLESTATGHFSGKEECKL